MEDIKILDSKEEIAKIDKENILGSIEELSEQCKDAWQSASQIEVPESYKDIQNIVMCGMGGSGLAARIIESVYSKYLTVPLVRVNDYNVPNFVNENTLVICSSYSGTTEETVQNANQAIAKNSKWMAIGTGNTIISLAQENNVPYYQINPKFNPSNQPRMAIGYSVVGQLALVSKTGAIIFQESDVNEIIGAMEIVKQKNNIDVPYTENTAKQLAKLMFGKSITFISGEHLVGAMHTSNNQFNENAKSLNFDAVIPELNHHLLEGLRHSNSNSLFFFAKSHLYSERIQKRFAITEDVVNKNNIETYEYMLSTKNELEQVFELIQFGAYVNFYLSMLYGNDPAPIPWVDYFKKQMGQPLGK